MVVIGYLLPGPFAVYVLNTGLFALSGGITNWLAIHMLFERVPLLYGSGVIPLRFEEFKLGIRSLIMEQFFNNADLESFFHGAGDATDKLSLSLQRALEKLDLEEAFESLLDVIMASSFAGMLGMLGGRDALDSLKTPFVEKMEEYFKEHFADEKFKNNVQEAVAAALDDAAIRSRLQELIDNRLDQMTPEIVKQIVQDMIHKHLGWLVVWGCFFGGLIGLTVTVIGTL